MSPTSVREKRRIEGCHEVVEVLLVMLYRQLLTSSLVFAVQTVLEAGPGGVSGYGGAATMMVQLVSDRLCYGDCSAG